MKTQPAENAIEREPTIRRISTVSLPQLKGPSVQPKPVESVVASSPVKSVVAPPRHVGPSVAQPAIQQPQPIRVIQQQPLAPVVQQTQPTIVQSQAPLVQPVAAVGQNQATAVQNQAPAIQQTPVEAAVAPPQAPVRTFLQDRHSCSQKKVKSFSVCNKGKLYKSPFSEFQDEICYLFF